MKYNPYVSPAFREIQTKARKDLADVYRKIRRDDKGSLARLMWKQYKEAEKKLINHILYGAPIE